MGKPDLWMLLAINRCIQVINTWGKYNCVLCLRVNIAILLCVLSAYIIGVLKSRRRRWAEHVARMGDRLGAYGGFVGRPEGKG